MNLTQCPIDTTIIGILATDAEQRGLTEQEFKDKFDKFGKDFVKWFNETHLPNVKEQTEAGFTAVNESLNTHKSENVAYQTSFTFTSAGGAYNKTITIALPIAPKSVNIIACVKGTKTASNGNWSQNAVQNCIFQRATDQTWDLYTGAVLVLVDSVAGNYLYANVTSVTATSITLAFNEYAGSFNGQNIGLVITALTH